MVTAAVSTVAAAAAAVVKEGGGGGDWRGKVRQRRENEHLKEYVIWIQAGNAAADTNGRGWIRVDLLPDRLRIRDTISTDLHTNRYGFVSWVIGSLGVWGGFSREGKDTFEDAVGFYFSYALLLGIFSWFPCVVRQRCRPWRGTGTKICVN